MAENLEEFLGKKKIYPAKINFISNGPLKRRSKLQS